MSDFCSRVANQLVNKRVIESLIRAGCFDSLGAKRSQMLAGLDRILERTARRSPANQISLLDSLAVDPIEANESLPPIDEFSSRELLAMEKEYLGVYLSGHPLGEWRAKFQSNGVVAISELEDEADGREVLLGGIITAWRVINTKAGSQMAGAKLEDLTGSVEVVIFPRTYEQVKDGYQPDRVAVIKGKLERQDEGLKVLAGQLRWLGDRP